MYNSPNPFTLFANRARRLLDRVESKIQRREVATRADLLVELVDSLARFSRGVQAPSMEVPVMAKDELLIRENVTRPIEEAGEDIELASEQIGQLREFTRQVFNLCQAERGGLQERLAENTALVDTFRLWVTDSDPTFLWYGDTFNDRSQVEASSTTFVDILGGTVTLLPISSRSLSPHVLSVTIDKEISAGGLPGINMEIRQPGREAFTGERKEPRPILYSDSQPRKDWLPAVLDGNPDTWFEWERNYVTVPQTVIKAGLAFVFDPAGKLKRDIPRLPNWNTYIRWPGEFSVDTGVARKGYPLAYFNPSDRQVLRLGLIFTLDQPRLVSWMQLVPFVRGNTYPEVEQILVSVDGDQWRPLLETPTVLHPRINRGVDFTSIGASTSNFEGVGVWPMPATPIRYVKVILAQGSIYSPPLGLAHRMYMGPRGKKRVKGPISVVGSFDASLAGLPSIDFSVSETESLLRIHEAFDIFQGYRQAIAIRDITLEQRTYADSGQLFAKPFSLPPNRRARAVALIVTEKIPDEWPERAPDGRPWIAYEISDNGQDWRPIVPQVAQLEDSVVRFDVPAQTLYFRATFTRPEDRPTESPILYAYALKVLP